MASQESMDGGRLSGNDGGGGGGGSRQRRMSQDMKHELRMERQASMSGMASMDGDTGGGSGGGGGGEGGGRQRRGSMEMKAQLRMDRQASMSGGTGMGDMNGRSSYDTGGGVEDNYSAPMGVNMQRMGSMANMDAKYRRISGAFDE
jgi:hypothetical protein